MFFVTLCCSPDLAKWLEAKRAGNMLLPRTIVISDGKGGTWAWPIDPAVRAEPVERY